MSEKPFFGPYPANQPSNAVQNKNRSQMSCPKFQQSLVADRVEVTIKDQFVSRRDMWHFIQHLENNTIFKGKQLNATPKPTSSHIDFSSVTFKIRSIFTKIEEHNQYPIKQTDFLTSRVNNLQPNNDFVNDQNNTQETLITQSQLKYPQTNQEFGQKPY